VSLLAVVLAVATEAERSTLAEALLPPSKSVLAALRAMDKYLFALAFEQFLGALPDAAVAVINFVLVIGDIDRDFPGFPLHMVVAGSMQCEYV
jgi:hypothetical protein